MNDNFLADVLNQLIDDASELKLNAETEFQAGMLTAYYQVISKLLNQAEAFGMMEGLPEDLRDYEPEALLG